MKAGTSGFQERSRVQTASKRVNSVSYSKATAAGSGGAEESDPSTQAERYVSRIAGPAELQWAQNRASDYLRVREMRVKVANMRLELLQRAVDEKEEQDGARKSGNQNSSISETAVKMGFVRDKSDSREFLCKIASPEQIASVLAANGHEEVIVEIEKQISEVKRSLLQQEQARLTS